MKRVAVIVGAALLVILLLEASLLSSAELTSQPVTGEVWQTMSPDARRAFVWGIANLVELERAQGAMRGNRSFIPFLVKGLSGKPMTEVVRQVDAYYEAHPAELKRPVVEAIFQTVVLPAFRAEKSLP